MIFWIREENKKSWKPIPVDEVSKGNGKLWITYFDPDSRRNSVKIYTTQSQEKLDFFYNFIASWLTLKYGDLTLALLEEEYQNKEA